MTQQQKRIKLAEFDGWLRGEANVNPDHSKAQGFWHKGMFYIGDDALPDYFGDLNVTYKVEKKMTDMQYRKYCKLLDEAGYDDRGVGYPNWSRSATADQRAEAIGQTLNLW